MTFVVNVNQCFAISPALKDLPVMTVDAKSVYASKRRNASIKPCVHNLMLKAVKQSA